VLKLATNVSRILNPFDANDTSDLKEFYYLTQDNIDKVTSKLADSVTNLISK
jgi:hypothetical protein